MNANRSFLASFLVLLLSSILASNVLFMHSHIERGHVVMHTHPFALDEKGDVADHQHTDEELVFFDFYAHQSYVRVEICSSIDVLLSFAVLTDHVPAFDEEANHSPWDGVPTLRGPPYFS